MPMWSDPGEWLKYSNAIEAHLALTIGLNEDVYKYMLYPMWNQGVWQYPPLFFIILIPLIKLLNPFLALKLMGSLLLSLQPIPTYFISKRITKSRIGGLLAAYISSLMPLYLEMYGWGGYPNLMGFLLLATNIYFTLAAIEEGGKKYFSLMLLTSMLIPLTHHLTTGIHLGVLGLWMIMMNMMKKLSEIRYLAYNFCTSSATLFLYRIILAYPSQFVTFNEAAYYSLRVDFLNTIVWLFKSPILMSIVIIIAIYLFLKRNILDRRYQALLLSWTLFPVLATQGYLFNFTIDYNRVFFFAVQPIPLIVASPFTSINSLDLNGMFGSINYSSIKKYTVAIAIIVIVVLSPFLFLLAGFETMRNVVGWYSSQDPYGDIDKAAALKWIRYNTEPNSTFVADEFIGRWIEGYADRRTLLYMEPRFLFIEGQLDRYYIASSILLSNHEIRNKYFRVMDQTPYSTSFSPSLFVWSKGEYKETLFVNDTRLNLETSNKTYSVGENKTKAEVSVKSDRDSSKIITTYNIMNRTSMITSIVKTIEVYEKPQATLKYDVHNVSGNMTIELNVFPSRKVSLVEITPRLITLHLDIGVVRISINTPSRIENPTEHTLLITSKMNDSFPLIITVSTSGDEYNKNLNDIILIRSNELINDYGIDYIVVPRVKNMRLSTWDVYQFLLKKYEVSYVNDRVIILSSGRNTSA
ncbi:MAG: hypothetical protein QW128_07165 [Thermoprotei archaeon]